MQCLQESKTDGKFFPSHCYGHVVFNLAICSVCKSVTGHKLPYNKPILPGININILEPCDNIQIEASVTELLLMSLSSQVEFSFLLTLQF